MMHKRPKVSLRWSRSATGQSAAPTVRRSKLWHRVVISFLIAVLPIQWANAVTCAYCHLGADLSANGLGLAALHVHATADQFVVGHTNLEHETAASTLDDDPLTPSAEKCETCKVISLVGPNLERQELQALRAQAPCLGCHPALVQADISPPEFVPI